MNIYVEIDAKDLQRAMRESPVKVMHQLNRWVTKTTLMTEREAKIEASEVIDTGQTQSSIHSSVTGLNGVVKPTAKHAIFAHEGRKPGRMPPFAEGTPLNSWARRHGVNPFLVARSIGRKGSRGYPFMTKAYATVKPRAERDAQATLTDIVRSI